MSYRPSVGRSPSLNIIRVRLFSFFRFFCQNGDFSFFPQNFFFSLHLVLHFLTGTRRTGRPWFGPGSYRVESGCRSDPLSRPRARRLVLHPDLSTVLNRSKCLGHLPIVPILEVGQTRGSKTRDDPVNLGRNNLLSKKCETHHFSYRTT